MPLLRIAPDGEREFRPVPKPTPPDKQAAKAGKAVQRAIRKDNPAKEPPTVGKPIIIDPPDETKPPSDTLTRKSSRE
jgi:hypothetical protein